jgi:hypothetical protein
MLLYILYIYIYYIIILNLFYYISIYLLYLYLFIDTVKYAIISTRLFMINLWIKIQEVFRQRALKTQQ